LNDHRADLEALRDMVLADKVSGVRDHGDRYSGDGSLSFGPPEELGIPPARAALYRQRMKAAGTEMIFVRAKGTVHFATGGWGFGGRGWRQSLMWAREPPSPLLPTIDGARVPRDSAAYSALGGGWYAEIIW
jgi:hypothetical protein